VVLKKDQSRKRSSQFLHREGRTNINGRKMEARTPLLLVARIRLLPQFGHVVGILTLLDLETVVPLEKPVLR
jgi:hypothetical protein